MKEPCSSQILSIIHDRALNEGILPVLLPTSEFPDGILKPDMTVGANTSPLYTPRTPVGPRLHALPPADA